VDRARWNATPLTTYYACSMAKNVDGKWGELKKVKFTTPAAKE
jgi:fibronectin type III domain protein